MITQKMMVDAGTPWAQEYIGSGRLTGLVFNEPTYTSTGDVAPGWRYVGNMTEIEFWEQAEAEQLTNAKLD